MDVKIINPFLASTLDVTRSMAQIEPTLGQPTLKQNNASQGDVTGLIELTDGTCKGSLSVTFTKEALLLLYHRMLGEKLEELDESTYDLAGEITNMVCGGAKQRLSETGANFNLTQPKILTGSDHEIVHFGAGPVLSLNLQLEQANIFIEVCLNR